MVALVLLLLLVVGVATAAAAVATVAAVVMSAAPVVWRLGRQPRTLKAVNSILGLVVVGTAGMLCVGACHPCAGATLSFFVSLQFESNRKYKQTRQTTLQRSHDRTNRHCYMGMHGPL